jgi:protein-S-isoprenylcysteine O-methyltransferase Ste14
VRLSTRAVLAFLALPAVVAGFLPALIARGAHASRYRDASLAPFAIGTVCLIWCVRDFFVRGSGTLAPWDPPRRLVVGGLYRFVRNPMYLSVASVILGWSLYFGSWQLALYLAIVAVGFHLRVMLYEEPVLSRLFRSDWDQYKARVPRWFPRFQAGVRDKMKQS